MNKIGFVVNPIAGIGGRVALKGSDGVVELARRLGGTPLSPIKARSFLIECRSILRNFEILTAKGKMGEEYLLETGLSCKIVYFPKSLETTSDDTKEFCRVMNNYRPDILIFVGGDGTARDILDSLDRSIPVLGIPGGVKIYSGVFSITPRHACEVLYNYLRNNYRVEEREVLDIDENAYRNNNLKVRLYGYLKVVVSDGAVQNPKMPSNESDEIIKEEIAEYFIENVMRNNVYYLMGPGTTVKEICRKLKQEYTLLGVDVLYDKKIIKRDCSERDILEILNKKSEAYVVVSPLGSQSTLFGRGNQQISPEVIRKIGKDNIIIVSLPGKLKSGRLYVDTGDPSVDEMLRGYFRVLVGYGKWKIVRIE